MSDALRENTRIDKGSKRTRRSLPWRRAPDGTLESIPAGLDPQEVLKRYLNAPTSSWVARELGVKRSSLTKWLRDTVPNEWKAVQVIRAQIMKEDGQDGLMASRNVMDLARAREVLRAAQWDLERLDSANYAQKQEHMVTVQPVLNITLAALPQPNPIIDLPSDAVRHIDDKPK